MKNFILNGATRLWLAAAILAITAMAFTACAKKSEAQTDYSIYSIWRYVSSADVEHGGAWVDDGEKSIAIFKDGEYAVVISGSYAWRGFLHDRGDYYYTFNAIIRLDYETGIVYNVEGQAPYTFALKYDPQTRRLISADHTVEEYYEWFSESGYVPDIDFSNTYQEFQTADISAFSGTWVNSEGGTFTILQPQSWENEFPGGFKQFENYFHWTHPAGDFGIYLVPAGIDLILHGNVLLTDATKMRLITEDLHSAPVVYYREGELPSVSESNDLVIGTWMFVSGSFVYFFGQSPSIHFLPDKTVIVHEQGDQYLRIARSGIWGFTPEGQLFVEFDWNTYLFTFSSDGEELIIIDSEGDRGVFGKVRG